MGGRRRGGGGGGRGRWRETPGRPRPLPAPSPRAASYSAPPGQGAEKTATGGEEAAAEAEEAAAAEAGFGVSLRSGGGGCPSAPGEAATRGSGGVRLQQWRFPPPELRKLPGRDAGNRRGEPSRAEVSGASGAPGTPTPPGLAAPAPTCAPPPCTPKVLTTHTPRSRRTRPYDTHSVLLRTPPHTARAPPVSPATYTGCTLARIQTTHHRPGCL